MEWWHLYAILAVVVAAIAGLVVFLRKRYKRNMEEQNTLVNQHKVATSILVLNKRKEKVQNANLPKSVIDQVPAMYKFRKVPIVKAKVGPQVLDLLCDEKIFDDIPDKKTINVELAGIFIAGIKKAKK
jgi:hypothetical protein